MAARIGPELQLKPIVAPQIFEHVAETLRAQIVAGVVHPGDRLPSERDLAKTLAISRPSVREGIAQLQLDGIVVTRRGAGTYVAADALERLSEDPASSGYDKSPLALLEVREHLEPTCARLAARHAVRDPRTEALLERMERVIDIEDAAQRQVWSETDRLFHRGIAFMAQNPVLAEICSYVAEIMNQPLWRRLRDESLISNERVVAYVDEHHAIYEAVSTGDLEASAFFARRHVQNVRRHMELHAVDSVDSVGRETTATAAHELAAASRLRRHCIKSRASQP